MYLCWAWMFKPKNQNLNLGSEKCMWCCINLFVHCFTITTSCEQYHFVCHLYQNEFTFQFQLVWLPGDNDIGGEFESIKQDKIEAFEKYFHQPSVITFRNISIYKVNGIIHSIPKIPADEENSSFKIVVSHYPITTRHVFGQEVGIFSTIFG